MLFVSLLLDLIIQVLVLHMHGKEMVQHLTIVEMVQDLILILQIPLTKPKVLFYEYDQLAGLNILKNVKNTVVGYENVVSLYAVPIGFNLKTKPSISWNLSGQSVNNQENPYLLSFNKP